MRRPLEQTALTNLAPIIITADGTFTRQIFELEQACFTTPWPLREVRAFVDLSAGDIPGLPIVHHSLVAFVGGSLAGYALTTYRREEAQVHRLATLAEFRGRGVARCLLAAIELRCRARKLPAVGCVVRESNLAGQLFLKSCGYRAPGADAIQPGAFLDGETGYVMVRALDRPVKVRIVQ